MLLIIVSLAVWLVAAYTVRTNESDSISFGRMQGSECVAATARVTGRSPSTLVTLESIQAFESGSGDDAANAHVENALAVADMSVSGTTFKASMIVWNAQIEPGAEVDVSVGTGFELTQIASNAVNLLGQLYNSNTWSSVGEPEKEDLGGGRNYLVYTVPIAQDTSLDEAMTVVLRDNSESFVTFRSRAAGFSYEISVWLPLTIRNTTVIGDPDPDEYLTQLSDSRSLPGGSNYATIATPALVDLMLASSSSATEAALSMLHDMTWICVDKEPTEWLEVVGVATAFTSFVGAAAAIIASELTRVCS